MTIALDEDREGSRATVQQGVLGLPETEPGSAESTGKIRGAFVGHLDRVGHDLIAGWAFDPSLSPVPVALVISANGRPIGRVVADRFRTDLAEAGLGEGKHAFNFNASKLLSSDISYEIRVSREDDNTELPASPKFLYATEASYSRSIVRTKTDIINLLIDKYGFTSYLEIASPTTGLLFDAINRDDVKRCHRILYNIPADFDDGYEVTWNSTDTNLDDIASRVFRQGLSYDVVFIDSYHTAACSTRDLSFALSVLSSGGVIVMHDASPPKVEFTRPEFMLGSWCGQSYAALIDFLMLHPEIGVYVVDVDWGVAVLGSSCSRPISTDEAIRVAWHALPDDPEARFAFFDANRKKLVNLISVDEFLAFERMVPSAAQARQFTEIFPVGRAYGQAGRHELMRDIARVHAHLGNAAEARRLLEIGLAENTDTPFLQGLLAKLSGGPAGVG